MYHHGKERQPLFLKRARLSSGYPISKLNIKNELYYELY
jgi:hypothetical protein